MSTPLIRAGGADWRLVGHVLYAACEECGNRRAARISQAKLMKPHTGRGLEVALLRAMSAHECFRRRIRETLGRRSGTLAGT